METCLNCGADMHCCLNCDFYEPQRSDGCSLRNLESPRDKERWCDCSEFRLADRSQRDNIGPSIREEAQKKFNALFKDDC